MAESVQRSTARGAAWMVLYKLVERSLGVLSTIILARLLVPADFGIVAMALSFIVLAELLAAYGFDIALIQNQSATKEHYNTAWTGNFLLGLSITILMILLAAPIANFYRRSEVQWVVAALAFGPLLSGSENIGVVAFRKELNFRREFFFQLSRKLIGFSVCVPLAYFLRNYWALVAGTLTAKLAGTVTSYLMHPFRPRFSLSGLNQLFARSRWLLFINMIAFFKERSSDFFLGRLYGSASLGLYGIACELANLPTTEFSAPINRALLPGFARMTEPAEVSAAYVNAIEMLALLALPAAAGIFAVASFLVPAVLGPKWLDAVPVIGILAFNGALLTLHSSICAVLIGRGFTAQVTLTNLIYVLLLLALLALFAIRFGVTGAAYAALFTSVLTTPIYLHQMRRCLGIAFAVFLRALVRPLSAAVLMAISVRTALPAFSPAMPYGAMLAWLIAGVAAGIVTYFVLLLALWTLAGSPPGAERTLLERARLFARSPRMPRRSATAGSLPSKPLHKP